ncbi:4069_t:CDS:2 [Funneliformis geosporum]|nr:4069_t:CDS:2 [Funneliformis geosporum]
MTEVSSLLSDSTIPPTYNSVVISLPVVSTNIKHQLLLDNKNKKWNSLKAIFQLLLLFLASIFTVYLTLMIYLPPLNEEQRNIIRLPNGIEDLQALNKILAEYMDQYYYSVMTVFVVVYIFMWLSILGGALFRLPIALFLICCCSSAGATNCYLLSRKFGRTFVKEKFSEKLDKWAEKLQSHSRNLLSYMIVLRLSPFPPNWFANVAAPHVGVPLKIFSIGTFFGVAGPSLIHAQAGLTIEHLTSTSDFKIFSFTNVGALVLFALAVLLPVWFRKKVEKEGNNQNNLNSQEVTQIA